MSDDATETTGLLQRSTSSNGTRRSQAGYHSNVISTPSSPTGAHPRRRFERNLSLADAQDCISLTWDKVDVYVRPDTRKCCRKGGATQPKHVLRNVSGCVEPGTLLAIMGASGAGKTTLLNVLNQRNLEQLEVSGNFRVNGSVIGSGISAVSAYVQQDDLFFGVLTVKEHLWFQAMLRMDRHHTNAERRQRVADVIQELGLGPCENTNIGTPNVTKGVSGGERKRLAFASEILTNPALLFCDEPTSGLDAFMAENVVQTLKLLASRGKTIVCTIHQPSSEVYALFDNLLLMADGRAAYIGPALEAAPFFEKVGYTCPVNFNPADFFIRTLAVVPGKEDECRQRIAAICQSYENSPHFTDTMTTIQSNITKSDAEHDFLASYAGKSQYKSSWGRQFVYVLWRSWVTTIREPIMARARLMQSVVVALLFGLIYLQQVYDQKGVMNINGALFLLQTQVSFGNLFAIINTFPLEFPIFKREHHNGMYRVDVYYLSKLIAEIPLFLITSIVLVTIAYWMMGLNEDFIVFLICLGVLVLISFVATAYGYLLSSSTSNAKLATAISPMIVIPMMLFGGFFLNSDSVPVYFIWLKYLSWFNYGNEVLIINQWSNVKNITCDMPVPPTTNGTMPTPPSGMSSRCFHTGDEVIASLGYDKDNVVMDVLIMAALAIGFRIASFFIILFRSRRPNPTISAPPSNSNV